MEKRIYYYHHQLKQTSGAVANDLQVLPECKLLHGKWPCASD